MEARAVSIYFIFIRSVDVRMGFSTRSTREFSAFFLQQISVVADVDGGIGDDLLPKCVDGRVITWANIC